MAKKSVLQQKRAAYQPKGPAALWGAVKAVKGEPTQSVGDQEEIQKLFPNTYGLPQLTFEKADSAPAEAACAFNVGVILSGGQATTSSADCSMASRPSTRTTVCMDSSWVLVVW